MKKRLLILSALALLLNASSWAYDFKVGDIYYNILSKEDLTCEVSYDPGVSDDDYDETYYYIDKLVIPDTVAYLGSTYSVVAIGTYAFLECSNMTEVTIPNSVTTIGEGAFMSCWSLTQVTIPNSVTTIGESAFDGCEGLTHVTIPNSVTTISYGAFWGCMSLTEVTIPNSVTSIGKWAFRNCTSLMGIYSLNPEPPTCGSDVFRDVDINTCVLYVPEGTKETYSAADVWKDFLNIVDNQPNGIESVAAGYGNSEAAVRYTLDGRQVSTPQRGVNILRYGDGTAKKVLVR